MNNCLFFVSGYRRRYTIITQLSERLIILMGQEIDLLILFNQYIGEEMIRQWGRERDGKAERIKEVNK